MQICVNKTQIQLVAGSHKGTLGDSGMDVASGVPSTGALASLRGDIDESLLGDSSDFLSCSVRGTAQMHRQ